MPKGKVTKEKIPKEKAIPIFEEFENDEAAMIQLSCNDSAEPPLRREPKLETDNIESTFEEKKESLLILATLGMTKDYLGEELTIQKIHKLSKSSVSKYFNRYQLVQGKKVTDTLRGKGIRFGIKLISYLLPLVDQEKLVNDLENDELVNRELSSMIGLMVLKGGRFVALASGLIQVANHVVFDSTQLLITPPTFKTAHAVDNTLPTE